MNTKQFAAYEADLMFYWLLEKARARDNGSGRGITEACIIAAAALAQKTEGLGYNRRNLHDIVAGNYDV